MTGQKDPPQKANHQVPTKQIGTNPLKKKAHQNALAKEEEPRAAGLVQAKVKAAILRAALLSARKRATHPKNHILADQVMAATDQQDAANHILAG